MSQSIAPQTAVAVVNVADFARAVEWWKTHFGFDLNYSMSMFAESLG
jgi:hypothetical protein